MASKLFQVTERVWCVRRASYFTCSYIVKSSAGVVLIDAGMDSGGRDMLEGLAALGIAPADVRAILLTHWHNDHAAGGRVMKQLTNAPVYYHPLDEDHFTGVTRHGGLRGWVSDLIPEVGPLVLLKGLLGEATPEPVSADVAVADGDLILGEFLALHTPGHTPGHASYYYQPDRVLFAGDALAVIGGRVRFMARPVTLDRERARESMLRCLRLAPAAVCPGHREPLTQGAAERCEEMARHIEAGGAWPLLG